MLIESLDRSFPAWKDYINYIDADTMSSENLSLAQKLRVMGLPSFTDEDNIIHKGYRPEIVKDIIARCKRQEDYIEFEEEINSK